MKTAAQLKIAAQREDSANKMNNARERINYLNNLLSPSDSFGEIVAIAQLIGQCASDVSFYGKQVMMIDSDQHPLAKES